MDSRRPRTWNRNDYARRALRRRPACRHERRQTADPAEQGGRAAFRIAESSRTAPEIFPLQRKPAANPRLPEGVESPERGDRAADTDRGCRAALGCGEERIAVEC